jgi:hypothetical protein
VQRLALLIVRFDVPVLERDDAVTLVDRERRVHVAIEEREERRGDGDGDRHPHAADERQAGILDQHARAELRVEPRLVEQPEGSGIALP